MRGLVQGGQHVGGGRSVAPHRDKEVPEGGGHPPAPPEKIYNERGWLPAYLSPSSSGSQVVTAPLPRRAPAPFVPKIPCFQPPPVLTGPS